jgi:inhibitor of cysteine peptidase
MKPVARIAALVFAASAVHAQDPAPSPPAAGERIPVLEIDANEKPIEAKTSLTNSPKMNEPVNLGENPVGDVFSIDAPADSPNPEKAPEISGKLPGEEEARPRPEVTGTVQVTAKNNGQIVQAQVGNLVSISLESNPSTGYSWELRDFEFGVAEFYSSDLVAREEGNVLFGAPGDTVIMLQAVKPGTQKIQLVYRRIWEAPDQVAATFSFQLEVAGEAAPTTPAPAAAPSTPAP